MEELKIDEIKEQNQKSRTGWATGCLSVIFIAFYIYFLTSTIDSAVVSTCIDTCKEELKDFNIKVTADYDPVGICINKCRDLNGICEAKGGSGGPYMGCVACGIVGGKNCERYLK